MKYKLHRLLSMNTLYQIKYFRLDVSKISLILIFILSFNLLFAKKSLSKPNQNNFIITVFNVYQKEIIGQLQALYLNAYGNRATCPMGANACDPTHTVIRDDFNNSSGNESYDNQDGNTNWTTDWTESGDDGDADTGDVQINGNDELQFDHDDSSPPSVSRGFNLSGAYRAHLNLSFFLDEDPSSSYSSSDEFVVEISSDGGSTYTALDTILGSDYPDATTGGNEGETFSYGISSHISNDMRVRLRVVSGFAGSNENLFVDFIEIIGYNLGVSVSTTNGSPSCTGGIGLGSMTVLGHGGYPPFEYSIDGTNFQTSELFSNLLPGNYTITVRDNNGTICTTTTTIETETEPAIITGCAATVTGATPVQQNYIIDFSIDAPTITGGDRTSSAMVTGNVLNAADSTNAGFDYMILATTHGGPSGSSPVAFDYNESQLAATVHDNADPTHIAGNNYIEFSLEGTNSSTTPRSYYRDPSSYMRLKLSLDNTSPLENFTYSMGDIDYNFIESDAADKDFGEGESNNYRQRSSYIDRIRVLTGAGTNTYISTGANLNLNGDIATAAVTDVNNNNYPDVADDGRVSTTDPLGYFTVNNATTPLASLEWLYYDAAYGIEGDPDGLHDFDSGNQLHTLAGPIIFSQTNYMFCETGSATLTACAGATNITWFNSADTQVGTGSTLTVTNATAGMDDTTDSYYFTATSQSGCPVQSAPIIVKTFPAPSIISVTAQNCIESVPNTFTAEWQVIINYDGFTGGDISYRRNSEVNQTFTPTTSPDTVSITGVPADGEVSDTIYVFPTNNITCIDTFIVKRPVPCPTNLGSNAGEICASLSNTEIKGTVFEDWNYDGVMNQSDTIGIQGVQVQIYDCDNILVATTYTDANGNYQFTGLTTGQDYRVEFNLPEAVSCWAKPTLAGLNNGTTVQFVQPGNCASLGVADPSIPCQSRFVSVPSAAEYIIDMDTDVPVINIIDNQNAEVTGNVLNAADLSDAGFDYQFVLNVSGGPSPTSTIPFPGPTAVSQLDAGRPQVETQGGMTSVSIALEGTTGSGGTDGSGATYYRDTSSNLLVSFSLNNNFSLENVTYTLGDIDHNFIPNSGCDGEPNDYSCRPAYIDRVEFLNGLEHNTYTIVDPSQIIQVGEHVFRSNFTDTNNNGRPDINENGKSEPNENFGNLMIHNPGSVGQSIMFNYDDPGQGLDGDSDGFHDFDSGNQLIAILTGMTFDATLCGGPTLEIGNYIWCDSINNGIQDACERGIDNIIVQLYDRNGVLVGQDTSSNSGQYYFNQNNVDTTGITMDGSGIASPVTAWSGMSYSTQYFIVFGNSQFATGEFSANGEMYGITSMVNAGSSDDIDSDVDGNSLTSGSLGARPDGLPFIDIATSATGCGDHKYDLGLSCLLYDWGDLPDIANGSTGVRDYETYDSTGGPSHQIIAGLFLGDTVDAEIDGIPDTLAVGDDIKDGYDDEDGIIIFPSLNISPGGIIRLPLSVTNMTGDTAYIEAWIDWDGDGDFIDANEMVADLKDNKDGVFPTYLEINVPPDALIGSLLGFRIRLSNVDNMTPYGRVNSGEIEDYLIGLECPQVICLPISTEVKRE